MGIKLGDALVFLGAAEEGLKKDLDQARKTTDAWVKNVSGSMARVMGGALVAAVGAGAAAVGGLAIDFVKFSDQARQAQARFQDELGATADQARILGDISQQVFRNRMSGDLLSAADAVIAVRQQLGKLSSEEIVQTASGVSRLSERFDQDLGRSVDAVTTLVQNFDLTTQEALDFIAAGFQRGLDRSGDFLESITEYAPQFSSARAGAGEFFSAMETGLQGGVLGTDRALDMFKEFRVRLLDGSSAVSEGLATIGISVDELTEKINDGSLSWSEAFGLVTMGIAGLGDQSKQIQTGVALLGTQFEDMGTEAALGVNLAAVSMADLAGAADKVQERYTSLSEFFQGLRRRILVSLSPLRDVTLGVANEAIPAIESLMDRIAAAVAALATGLAQMLRSIGGLIASFFDGVRGNAGQRLEKTAEDARNWGKNIVIGLAQGMASAIGAVINVLNQIGQVLLFWLQPSSPPRIAPDLDKWAADTMKVWAQGLVDGLDVNLFSSIAGTIEGLFRSLPGRGGQDDKGLIPAIFGSRSAIARAIEQVRETGNVGAAVMEMVRRGMRGLPQVAEDYVAAMLKLHLAQREVATAQDEVNRVTQKYKDLLDPINKELTQIGDRRAQIRDEKRLADLRKAVAEGNIGPGEEELALLEIRELELRAQMRTVQEQQRIEEEAAQTKLDAATEAQTLAQEEVDLQEALIAAQTKSNQLAKEQMSLLKQLAGGLTGLAGGLAGAAEDLAGAGGGLGGLGAGISPIDVGGLVNLEGAGGRVQAELQALTDSLNLDEIAAEVQAIFDPLGQDAQTLGETFGALQDVLKPTFDRMDALFSRIGEFLDQHSKALIDWVLTLGGALVGARIGLFISGIVSAIGGLASSTGILAGIGAVIAALGGPITILIAAVSALGVAWATNFGGIRDKMAGLLEWAEQFFGPVVVWLSSTVPKAAAELAEWFQTNLVNAQARLADSWESGLLAIIREFWEFLTDSVFPLLESLAELFQVVLSFAIEVVAGVIQNRLLPRFQAVFDILTKTVFPALETLHKWFVERLSPAMDIFRTAVLDPLGKAFDQIGEAIDGLIGWIDRLIDSFKNVDIPDWAKSASPPPLATAFADISAEVRQLSGREIPDLRRELRTLSGIDLTANLATGQAEGALAMGAANGTGAQGPAPTIHNHFERIVLDGQDAVVTFLDYLQGEVEDNALLQFLG